jgi:hypothetical protein
VQRPDDLVDTGAAAVAAGRTQRAVQLAVKAGRLRNYSAKRNRVLVSLGEVLGVFGDPLGLL